jgi:spermidine/putrescine transport system substrate-binding protein
MKAVFPDEQAARKLEMLKPMNTEERTLLNRIWTEIKAS